MWESLIALGYDVGPTGADGEFGKNTYKAVVAFQKDHGLDADGEVGQMTWQAIKDALAEGEHAPDQGDDPPEENHDLDPPFIQTGDRGDAVSLLQAAINLRAYNCGTVDGDFGPKTAAALNRFKESKGLEPNGKCDTETWSLVLQLSDS